MIFGKIEGRRAKLGEFFLDFYIGKSHFLDSDLHFFFYKSETRKFRKSKILPNGGPLCFGGPKVAEVGVEILGRGSFNTGTDLLMAVQNSPASAVDSIF